MSRKLCIYPALLTAEQRDRRRFRLVLLQQQFATQNIAGTNKDLPCHSGAALSQAGT